MILGVLIFDPLYMELSILISKILGLSYLAMGLGILLNGAYYKKAFIEMKNNSAFVLLGGMISLIIGVLVVNVHNVWVSDWTVIVTIFGWVAVIKGIMLFVAPNFLMKSSSTILKKTQLIGWGSLIFGLLMGYYGFFL